MRYLILMILTIAAVGVGWFTVLPAWDEVRTHADTRQEYAEALAKVEEFKQLRQEHIERFKAIPEDDMRRLREMLPEESGLIRLLMFVDAAAVEYGIDITGLGTTEAEMSNNPESGYRTHEISFNFTTDYVTMVNFLADLESRLRLVDVRQLEFSAPADQSEYTFGVTLQTYSL